MMTECYAPATGFVLEELDQFLQSMELEYDSSISYTIIKRDERGIAATGSLDGRVIKCVAVRPDLRGGSLSGEIVEALRQQAHSHGHEHVFLFTRPETRPAFERMGFYTVEETGRALLMEDRPDGLEQWLQTVPRFSGGIVGAIVANCDPITNGHLYLVQKAKLLCDKLYIFVLSEDRGQIPAADRLEMVRAAVKDIPDVIVCPAGDYQISTATFPAYFLRGRDDVERLGCELDLKLFACRIAAPLGISRRFVGQEPYSPLTGRFNMYMKEILPQYGVSLVEFSRLRAGDKGFVNAGTVRRLWEEQNFDALVDMVPPSTLAYLQGHRPLYGSR
ncbi:MAG: [citrate (pro-3S)-lyase] ligase [Oscillospiraceae bacterium]|nr:[citrate (pro-3S)-lyase] ligase [Oscillospiraceae bacterium]